MAWHYISGDSVGGDLANGGRQGDAGSTQRETGGGERRRAEGRTPCGLGVRGVERATKRLPSWVTVDSDSASRSLRSSGQEPISPSAAIRCSSSIFRTR